MWNSEVFQGLVEVFSNICSVEEVRSLDNNVVSTVLLGIRNHIRQLSA